MLQHVAAGIMRALQELTAASSRKKTLQKERKLSKVKDGKIRKGLPKMRLKSLVKSTKFKVCIDYFNGGNLRVNYGSFFRLGRSQN